MLRRLRDRLRRRTSISGAVVVALTTHPLEIRDFTPRPGPSARQGARPLSFRSGGTACGGAFFRDGRALLLKGSRRLFLLNTAPVDRSVVSSAATALRLFTRGRAHPEIWKPETRRLGARIHRYAACVRSAGSAYIAAGFLCPRTIPSTLQASEFGE
jgi:hypothetical protein